MKNLFAIWLALGLVITGCSEPKKTLPKAPAAADVDLDDKDGDGIKDDEDTDDGDVDEEEVVTITISPLAVTLLSGGTQTFTATVAGSDNVAKTFSVEEANGGVINATTGVYTAPLVAGTYHVVAKATADATKTARATITVNLPVVLPVGVTLGQTNITMERNTTQQFTATVANSADQSVTWSATGGTIDAGGLYTAPNNAGDYTITATSVADATKSASTTVTVTNNTPPPTPTIFVTITPSEVNVFTYETADFNVDVSGANNQVAWSVVTLNGGTINQGGTYTAPAVAGDYTIQAVSDHDVTAIDTAIAHVFEPTFEVSLDYSFATVETGATFDFDAEVFGPTNGNPVTWFVTGPYTGAFNGTVGGSGGYTAPLSTGTYTVHAVAKDNGTQTASAVVTVVEANPIVTITPVTQQMDREATKTFAVSVTNTRWNNWKVELTGTGWLNSGTTPIVGSGSQQVSYTSPNTNGTRTITVTSQNSGETAAATVTVTDPQPIITVVPVNGFAWMETAATKTFGIMVTNTIAIHRGYWITLVNSSYGSLSVTEGTDMGLVSFTAPAAAGSQTLRVTSKANGAFIEDYAFTVSAAVLYANLSPLSVTVATGRTMQFSGDVTGADFSANNGSSFSVQEGTDGGTIDGNGLYTAPITAGVYHVIIKSNGQPSVSETATVNVYEVLCPVDVYASQVRDNNDVTLGYAFITLAPMASSNTYFTATNLNDLGIPELKAPLYGASAVTYYTGPGADGLWQTADDVVGSYAKLAYDGNGMQTGYATYITGPDGQWFTADDVIADGAEYLYSGSLVSEIRRYAFPGNDGVQDNEVYLRTVINRSDINYRNYWVNNYWAYWMTMEDMYSTNYHYAPGADGIINTGDDTYAGEDQHTYPGSDHYWGGHPSNSPILNGATTVNHWSANKYLGYENYNQNNAWYDRTGERPLRIENIYLRKGPNNQYDGYQEFQYLDASGLIVPEYTWRYNKQQNLATVVETSVCE